jgi:hypothetical protein
LFVSGLDGLVCLWSMVRWYFWWLIFGVVSVALGLAYCRRLLILFGFRAGGFSVAQWCGFVGRLVGGGFWILGVRGVGCYGG